MSTCAIAALSGVIRKRTTGMARTNERDRYMVTSLLGVIGIRRQITCHFPVPAAWRITLTRPARAVVDRIKAWPASDVVCIFFSRLTSAMPRSFVLLSQRLGERATEVVQAHQRRVER